MKGGMFCVLLFWVKRFECVKVERAKGEDGGVGGTCATGEGYL